MAEFKTQQIKSVLKSLLKKNKMTYEAVAEELDCSIPTVKRILGPEELTLSRLLQFCKILNISLSDIDMLIEKAQDQEEEFTAEQQDFLVKNKTYFSYLLHLYRISPKEIAEKFKLSARSTDKYLMGLEKHGLIKVTGKLKVLPTYPSVPHLKKGPLAKAYYEKLIQNGAQFFKKTINDTLHASKTEDGAAPKSFGIVRSQVTELTYRNFVKDLNKLHETFLKTGDYEQKSLPADSLKTFVMMQGYALVDNENPHVALIENIFEEVTNL